MAQGLADVLHAAGAAVTYWRRCDVCKSKLYGDEDPPVCKECKNCCCTCVEEGEAVTTSLDVMKFLEERGKRFDTIEIGHDSRSGWIWVTGKKILLVETDGVADEVESVEPLTITASREQAYDENDVQVDTIQLCFDELNKQLDVILSGKLLTEDHDAKG